MSAKRRTAVVTESIAAPPEAVWQAVADVTRIGEWSPECTGCHWVGPVQEPRPGAQFVGSNRKGAVHWNTRCTVTHSQPGKVFAWRVRFGISVAEWSYRLVAVGDGTRVEQSWRDLRTGFPWRYVARIGDRLLSNGARAEHNEANMRATLSALKRSLESR